jgi:hypothetical protein
VQCSLVEVYRRLRGACRLHYQGDPTEDKATNTSETSVNFYQTPLHKGTAQKTAICRDKRRRENLKFRRSIRFARSILFLKTKDMSLVNVREMIWTYAQQITCPSKSTKGLRVAELIWQSILAQLVKKFPLLLCTSTFCHVKYSPLLDPIFRWMKQIHTPIMNFSEINWMLSSHPHRFPSRPTCPANYLLNDV